MALSLKQIAAASAVVAILTNLLYGRSIWRIAISFFIVSQLLNQLWKMVVYPKLFDPLRTLPGPSGGSFFSGHFRTIIKEPTGYPQSRWMKEVPNDGILFYRTMFNTGRVLLVSPKALSEVLVTKSYEFIKPPQIQQSIGRILGIGILFAEGDEHKAQRKNLNPAFSYRQIKDLYPIFWGKSQEMVAEIDRDMANAAASKPNISLGGPADVEKAPVSSPDALDASDWASRATLDIIGVAGLDQSFRAIQEPSNQLFQLYQTIFKPNRQAQFLALLGQFVPFWFLRSLPVKRNAQINEAKSFLRRTCMNIIQEKRAKMEAETSTSKEAGDSTNGDRDIISVALRSHFFTDDNLVDQLMTFLAAGHETTASSLGWAILTLCQNPTIQSRLRTELHTAISSGNLPSPRATSASPATAAQIDALPYLNAFCAEVLRFHPPVPFTLRVAACDTSIVGTFIPKGTTVVMSPLATNRNTDLWGPTADTFDPERWMQNPGSGGADSNFSLLTFLHGPRSCIGQGFAKAEFACLVAAWVAAFEMELVDKEKVIEIAGGVTQRPKGGVHIRAKAVNA